MKLSDYLPRREQEGPQDEDGQLKAAVREALYKDVPSERIAQLVSLGRARARVELEALIDQSIYVHGLQDVAGAQKDAVISELLDMILGLGPLEALLADDTVTEIMVNGSGSIYFERDGLLAPWPEAFDSEKQLRLVVDRIVSPLGRRVDEQQPYVNARLPEGHRVNIVVPPITPDGTAVTIRKFRPQNYSLDDLVALDGMTDEIAQLLRWAVLSRCNIAVSGGTGGGKTTLLNALSQAIPHSERVITIEDSAELRFKEHPHVVRMEARLANAEGQGEVTIRELVINALRMRPDRIVVGECRGAEALDMLQAMLTGHDGSLTTLHASSPEEVVARLVMMVRFGMDLPAEIIREQVFSALDLVVQQDRLAGGKRRVTQVAMRAHVEGHGAYVPVVRWDMRSDSYVWNAVPEWVSRLSVMGLADEGEVSAWEQRVQSCFA